MGLSSDRSVTVGEEVYVADASGSIGKGGEKGDYLGTPHNRSHGPIVLKTVDNLKGVFGYVVGSVPIPSRTRCVEIDGKNNVAGFFKGLCELCIIIELGLRRLQ